MKINKRYSPLLFATIMAVAMGSLMSFVLTAINTGFAHGFMFRWLRSCCIGVAVAFPTSLLVVPLARRLVKRLTR